MSVSDYYECLNALQSRYPGTKEFPELYELIHKINEKFIKPIQLALIFP